MASNTCSGIYTITHTSGRRYVGSAVSVSRRWYSHRSDLSRGCHCNQRLQNGWNKHGPEAYTFAVVEAVADVTDLIAREQHWINALAPHYNICRVAGSSLGLKRSDATRAAKSRVMMGHKHSAETRAKLTGNTNGAGGKGRKHTAETRAKMTASQKARKHAPFTPEHCAAISAGKAAARAKRAAA